MLAPSARSCCSLTSAGSTGGGGESGALERRGGARGRGDRQRCGVALERRIVVERGAARLAGGADAATLVLTWTSGLCGSYEGALHLLPDLVGQGLAAAGGAARDRRRDCGEPENREERRLFSRWSRWDDFSVGEPRGGILERSDPGVVIIAIARPLNEPWLPPVEERGELECGIADARE